MYAQEMKKREIHRRQCEYEVQKVWATENRIENK